MFTEYHPTAVHDLHESIPLLHTWNGTGPYNANLDPIAINEWLETSFHEVQALTALGNAGRVDVGLRRAVGPALPRLGREQPQLAGPRLRDLRQRHRGDRRAQAAPASQRYVDKPVTEREWYRAWPPDKKFVWSLRDNTNYMESGCLSILDYTAKNAKDMLRNFYRKGYNSWQKRREGESVRVRDPGGPGRPAARRRR